MLLAGHSRRGPPPQVDKDPALRADIRALLESGADVNAVQAGSGDSALHFAALRGAADIVALLKEFGASEELKNAAGRTPKDVLKKS
jgi:ankyrin repeat protein